MKKGKIVSAALALCIASAAAIPAIATAADEGGGSTNVTITTEINGNGVVTKYDGDKIVTDTYVADTAQSPAPTSTPASSGDKTKTGDTAAPQITAAPQTTAAPSPEAAAADGTPAPRLEDDQKPDANEDDSSVLYKLIKEYVLECLDLYSYQSIGI